MQIRNLTCMQGTRSKRGYTWGPPLPTQARPPLGIGPNSTNPRCPFHRPREPSQGSPVLLKAGLQPVTPATPSGPAQHPPGAQLQPGEGGSCHGAEPKRAGTPSVTAAAPWGLVQKHKYPTSDLGLGASPDPQPVPQRPTSCSQPQTSSFGSGQSLRS